MKLIPEQIDYYLKQGELKDARAEKLLDEYKMDVLSEGYKASDVEYGAAPLAATSNTYQQYLNEKASSDEFRNCLESVELPTPNREDNIAEVGSFVAYVDMPSYVNGTGKKVSMDPKYLEVLLIEGSIGRNVDMDVKCVSVSSPLGLAIEGHSEEEEVTFTTYSKQYGKITHNCAIQSINNEYIYDRYSSEYSRQMR